MPTTDHKHEPYSYHDGEFRCRCGATAPTGVSPWRTTGTATATAPRVIHWHTRDGVYGYKEGDILVDETGQRMVVVRTGHGLQLQPT